MLLSLAAWLQGLSPEFGFFRVFQYLTFRAVMAAMTALLIGLFAGPWVIRYLASLKIGQPIREYAMQTHLAKSGTPTMGGVLILISIAISTLLWFDWTNRFVWIVMIVTLGFGAIGWVDDWRKVVNKDPEGMKSREKYFWQSVIGLLAALYLVFSISESNNLRVVQLFISWVQSGFDVDLPPKAGLMVPFFKEVSYPLGVFGFVIMTYLVIVGSSNAVNLTDGLDGLAIMPVVMVGSALGVFAYVTGSSVFSKYLFFPHIPGAGELLIFCAAMAGAGLAFLWFNTHPAQVFMGDVGALALGGALGTIAVIVRQEIVLAIMGGIFVVEALSVMLQVTYFKYTKKRFGEGKRLFKMAPLHHHFEKSGWKETQVVVRFWIITMLLCLVGLAMARWCAQMGAQVTVVDTREQPPSLETLRAEMPTVVFQHAAQFSAELVEGSSIRAVCRSPGLSPAQIAPVLEAARAAGLPVWGELDLFSIALVSLKTEQAYEPKVLAITGTNGKTTVTSLTGQLVERAGKSVAVAGNIGPTLLDTLRSHIDAQSLPQVWVLELSSFQLDGVQGFMPAMGTVLNLTQDHLDWHGDMPAYTAAKARVFGAHSLDAPPMLLNRDDPAVLAMRPALIKGKPQRIDITFGADVPSRQGDYGLESVNGMTWLVRALEADETQKRRKGEEIEIHLQRLMPADALRIRGRHNAMNALAALALASAAGCSLSAMLYGLREYRGEPHRVEPVGIVREVEYFDDSKGTNVGATVAALSGLGADRKIVVILGGEGKGQDFSPLSQPVALYARAVVLIGRDAGLIEQALNDCGVPMQHASSLPEAVQAAAQLAHAGDAVLLSPACASFDMFKNYEHRAEVFVDAVKQMADDADVSIVEGA